MSPNIERNQDDSLFSKASFSIDDNLDLDSSADNNVAVLFELNDAYRRQAKSGIIYTASSQHSLAQSHFLPVQETLSYILRNFVLIAELIGDEENRPALTVLAFSVHGVVLCFITRRVQAYRILHIQHLL